MKVVFGILSMALVASGIVGVQVLLSDRWLWSAAPSHAYGLIGFIAIDLLLVTASWRRIGIAILGAALVSTAQFGAMVTDLVVGEPQGVPSVAFRAYLTGDASYIGLLIIQIAILIVAFGSITEPLWHNMFTRQNSSAV
jgi:hypothetical protein